MGCVHSSQRKTVDETEVLRRRGPRDSMVAANTELVSSPSAKEAQRLLASNGSIALAVPAAGFVLRYAFVSQRGYYPDAPDKANQDATCAAETLGGNKELHLFGVFDGHGEQGTECAQFTQEQLPANLSRDPAALAAQPDAALSSALVATNSQLHNSAIDDSLSGTTACCALVAGRTLYVANVGDSRAVLAEHAPAPAGQPSKLVALELSQDQTPFRTDECLRVIRAGARVLTLDQLEGLKDPVLPCWTNEADCDGDPPRLWSPHGMYPGTAFTRSIGDSAAESIGVIPDPEISVTQLGPQHSFVVLASDGVWEFITSQQAVDVVARHDNPYDAAKALVAQAYKLWLQRETRTDDISAIVLFLDWQQPQQEKSGLLSAPSIPQLLRTLSSKLTSSSGSSSLTVSAPSSL